MAKNINLAFLDEKDPELDGWKDLLNSSYKEGSISYFSLENLPKEGRNVVLVSGGDGSLNHGINKLMELEKNDSIEILYFPGGTGNDFSRAVGLYQRSQEEVANLLNRQESTPMHVAKMDEKYFVNMGSFGIFAEVTPEVDPDLKGFFGCWSYYFKGFELLTELRTLEIDFELEEETLSEKKCLGFFVANSRFSGGGIQITSKASPYTPTLDLVIIREAPLTELVRLGLELQKETPELDEFDIVYKQVKELSFKSNQKVSMSLDGENFSKKSGKIRMSRGKIRLILP